MVSCQMLSELEEVIQYKLVPERRDIIKETWWERLQVTKADERTQTLHSRATPNVKQMSGRLLKLPVMWSITHQTRYSHAETRRYFPNE